MADIVAKIQKVFPGMIIKSQEPSRNRAYLDLRPEDIPAASEFIFRDLGCRFITATALDLPSEIEILYHFCDDKGQKTISLRTHLVDKQHPKIQSITPIITGAEWIEREMWEMLGVEFIGHPNLKHLLLIDDWPEGEYPLRHDHKHDEKDEYGHES
jgi:NADH-quinone oxidoreductase subunit C